MFLSGTETRFRLGPKPIVLHDYLTIEKGFDWWFVYDKTIILQNNITKLNYIPLFP